MTDPYVHIVLYTVIVYDVSGGGGNLTIVGIGEVKYLGGCPSPTGSSGQSIRKITDGHCGECSITASSPLPDTGLIEMIKFVIISQLDINWWQL